MLPERTQSQQDGDNYWDAVDDVAEEIAEELGFAEPDERDELLYQLLHEKAETNEYVINYDLQIITLQHSENPCAALFNGSVRSGYLNTDGFPFAAFAFDAFVTDIAKKVRIKTEVPVKDSNVAG
jgi:hypothetical protein